MLILDLFFFFFNDTATTEIYTLSLHDALPICSLGMQRCVLVGDLRSLRRQHRRQRQRHRQPEKLTGHTDRKSTRLNSSHGYISYAVFCLKKKEQSAHARTNANAALPINAQHDA